MGEDFTFDRAKRQDMLDSFDEIVHEAFVKRDARSLYSPGDAVEAKLAWPPSEMKWTKLDPTKCGVFRFPESLTFVLHDEEPVAALGRMNGRVSVTEYTVGDDRLKLPVPINHPRAFAPWVTIWRGEQLFGISDVSVGRVLHPGDSLEFGPGDIFMKGWPNDAG